MDNIVDPMYLLPHMKKLLPGWQRLNENDDLIGRFLRRKKRAFSKKYCNFTNRYVKYVLAV